MRALRTVSERVPHLSRAARRNGFAARPHLPNGASCRRRADQPFLHRAHRALPGLPRMRNGVSVGRAIWAIGGGGARRNRKQDRSGRGASECCAGWCSASCFRPG